jgi:hypothetical protein
MKVRATAFASISAVALLALTTSPAAAVAAAAPVPGAADAAGAGITPSPDAPHSNSVIPGVTGAAIDDLVSPAARSNFEWLHRQLAGQADTGTRSASHTSAGTPDSVAAIPSSGHTGWGTHNDVWDIGGQATQTVNPNLHLPASDPDTIYAPTFIPAAISCIEMATYYTGSGSWVLAFDWCANNGQGTYAKLAPLSSLSAYLTQTSNGTSSLPAYTVQDVQTDPSTNSWTAYLFNYQTHRFDPFWTSASTDKYSQSGSRWDWWEVWWTLNPNTGQAYYCTDSVGTKFGTTALSYETYQNHWETATPANSHVDGPPAGDASGCSGLTFQMLTPNSNWLVSNG